MARFKIVYDSGGERRTCRIGPTTKTTIGRSTDNDVVLASPRISGHHAEIEVHADRLLIRDVGSKNGTWVGGHLVEKEREIEPGDRIDIGGVRIRIIEAIDPGDTSVTFIEETESRQQIFASIDAGLGTEQDASKVKGPPSRSDRSLAVMYAMGDILLEAKDEEDVAERMLNLVFDVIPAGQACVIFLDPEGEPRTGAARSAEGELEALKISRTILSRSLEEGVSLLTADATADERFQDGQSVIVQGIHAAMCAPLRGRKEALGAIYADTRTKRGVFTPKDLELLTTLGIQGGIAVENLRLAQRNLNAERLATMGGLIAGLSHDIRNIVTALRGGAYLMDKIVAASDDETLHVAWDAIRLSSDTIAHLVEDMVSYSKSREPEKALTDLNELVRVVTDRFAPPAEEAGTKLTLDLCTSLPQVEIDRGAIDRVLTNLVKNALDAVGEKGSEIRVITGPAPEPHRVQVTVADDGPGIPPESLERIFDLLYSTKGSKGTGFGLAIAEKIVTEHEGALLVESEPGEGAVFHLRL